jgi:hypothetical protein
MAAQKAEEHPLGRVDAEASPRRTREIAEPMVAHIAVKAPLAAVKGWDASH